jgi:hypothetical protein
MVAVGCGGADAGRSGLPVQVDTIGGVVHVRNVGAAPAWRLEPLFTLGSPDEGPQGFGSVTSILADSSGNLYVADRNAREIRVFGPDGAYLRTLGGPGRGPGEIQDLYSIAWLGGVLAVLDPGNGRLGLFSRDGAWLGSRPVQPITGPVVRLYRAADDEVYTWGVRRGDEGLQGLYLRHEREGATDTLVRPRRDRNAGADYQVTCSVAGGGLGFFSPDFAPRSTYTVAPGGVVASAWTAAYRIAFHGRAGDTVRVVERERAPVPISQAEWSAQMDEFQRLRERWGRAQCDPEEPARPPTKAALRDVFFDHLGRMWVEAYDESGFVFEVFDREGRLVGAVPVPPRDDRVEPYVRGERLYFVTTDSMGVQYVEAYRVKESRE